MNGIACNIEGMEDHHHLSGYTVFYLISPILSTLQDYGGKEKENEGRKVAPVILTV